MSLEMFLKYLISTNVYSNEAPGIILRFKFPNNYGASVINNKASYGHPKSYEIAVLYDDEIYYNSPITNDVIGYVNPADVGEILLQIKELEPKEK
tara:strand:+ start:2598 stop:2882 length:285 start_codon:yes stop_codon:yes gene_type:complete